MTTMRHAVPTDELRAVVIHVRALDRGESHRPSRAHIWAYAAFLVILLGSIRAPAPRAYLPSSLNPIEESRMRTLQSLGVVSSIAIASVATAQNAVQWRPSAGGNGHWYLGVPLKGSESWTEAKSQSEAKGGHLVTFANEAEIQWVLSGPGASPQLWNGIRGPYIGGQQGSTGALNDWSWITGEPWFPYWGVDNCGADDFCTADALTLGRCNSLQSISYNDWPKTISDCVAYSIVGSVVEWSADCNGDGVVDYGQIRAGLFADENADWIPDCCEQGPGCPVDAVQWKTQDGGNGHWYRGIVFQSATSWLDARAMAEAMGGHLATCTTMTEFDWIVAGPAADPALWTGTRGPFIGGIQDAGAPSNTTGWHWVTGEDWLAVWGVDNCGADDFCNAGALTLGRCSSKSTVTYNDWPATVTPCDADSIRGMIVEWSADCNANGLVDFGEIREGLLLDADHDFVPDCCEQALGCCPADVNLDGFVGGPDLTFVLAHWGTNGAQLPQADIDRNGVVNGDDMAVVLSTWGACY